VCVCVYKSADVLAEWCISVCLSLCFSFCLSACVCVPTVVKAQATGYYCKMTAGK